MSVKSPIPVRTTVRHAQLVADAVAVCCPYCGEPQPNPTDGSEQWELRHFRMYAERPRKSCCACDEEMFVFHSKNVQFR